MKILITGANSYIGTSVEKNLLSSCAQTQSLATFASPRVSPRVSQWRRVLRRRRAQRLLQ